jgi:hypothetical protein
MGTNKSDVVEFLPDMAVTASALTGFTISGSSSSSSSSSSRIAVHLLVWLHLVRQETWIRRRTFGRAFYHFIKLVPRAHLP